ncbi:tandem-95 repeat protein [Brevibacillus sp. SYSU BS000544]|uniref:tandem-95 repeat protein n=1 Tax=Brevibacillus sp. SYSU BS000544 TaxID=3416443 RepID=UPI003CE4AB6E
MIWQFQKVRRVLVGLLTSLLLVAVICIQSTYSASAYLWKSPGSAGTTYSLQGLHYGGGEWLALGISNTIVTSSDGSGWTRYNPSGAFGEWNDAYFDGNQWILVGGNGKIYTSSGSSASTNSWSSKSPSSHNDLLAITYGLNNKYYAVGYDGEIWDSSNKETWNAQTPLKNSFSQETSSRLTDIIYADGRMVIVSESGSIYVSADGVTWTYANSNVASSPLYSVTYGNGKFVAVGENSVSYSSDGNVWNKVTVPGNPLYSVTYGNGKFVTVGAGGAIVSSTDGITWNTTETSNTTSDFYSVAYSAEQQRFVTVGDNAIIRTQSHNTQLSGLSVSSGTLTPSFTPATTAYSANVASNVSSITVTPVKADVEASVEVRVNSGAYTPVTGATSGDLSLAVGANTIDLKVKAQDGVSERTYTITVTRAAPNASPTDITLTNNQISENAVIGTVIGTLGATDPDSAGPFGFSLVAGDTSAFVIDNGVLKSNAVFNYETKNSYNVTIQVTDPGGATYNKPFVITVTNANDVPVVSDSTKTGTEDAELAFSATDFTSKFYDEDSTSLNKIRIESLPANGGLMLDNAAIGPTNEITAADLSKLKFVPSSNWNGTTSFTWKGSDGVAYSASAATITIQLTGVNDAPSVSNSTKEGTEDTELFFVANDFLAHFSDVDQTDTLQGVQITSLPDKGTVKLNGNAIALNQVIPVADLSKLSFVPPANWDGSTSIGWKGSDGNLYSADPATLTVQILAANDLPTVNDSTKAGNEDVEITFKLDDFTTLFTDEEGSSLAKIQIVTMPSNGTLKVGNTVLTASDEVEANQLDQLRFIPLADWNGTTSFTWKGTDGSDYSASAATLTLQLAAVNDAPTVSNSTKEGTEDTELSFVADDFLAAFSDVDALAVLTDVKIVSLPEHGALKLNDTLVAKDDVIPPSSLSQLKFTPDPDWNGETPFQWKGSDGTVYSVDAAVLTIKIKGINDLPISSNVQKSGAEDSEATFTTDDFSSKFSGGDGDSLSKVQIVSLPANGTLKLDGNTVAVNQEIPVGELTKLSFIPDANWAGTTEFDWKGNDGTDYSITSAKVTITVTPVDDVPTITSIADQSINEDEESGDISFTVGDEEKPAEELTVTVTSSNETLVPLANVILGGNGTTRTIRIKPVANMSGRAAITVQVSDGTNTADESFDVTVVPVNDAPTVSNSNKEGTEDTELFFVENDFLTQFSDVDQGDTLSRVQITSLPDKGVLNLNGTAVSVNQEIPVGELTKLSFIPDANWSGTTEFDWKGNDGTDYSIASAKVTITITPVDDEPTITSIADQSINEDEESGEISFAVGDEEKPAEELTLTVTSSNETLIPLANVILGGNGTLRTIRIKPVANKNGSATITVQVSDGTNTVDETFDVTVVSVNDAPVATNGSLSVTANQPKQGSLAATDSDGDLLTYSIVQQGTKGNVTVDGSTGAYTYTPSPGATGNDSFTFMVNDGTIDSNTATVTVTITNLPPPIPVYYPPTISDIGNQTIQEDESTNDIAFAVNDPDTNVKLLTVQASSSNTKLVPNDRIVLGGSDQNRTIQVVPAADQSGSSTITVTVSDGQRSATDTFTITVLEVNDPPVANNQTLVIKTEGETKGTLTASDGEGNPLTYVLVTKASKGKVMITNSKKGEFTYTPNQGELGADSFTFKVSDGLADSNVATVSISREGNNNADLRALKVSSGKLKPSFSAKRTEYTVEVNNKVDSIKVTPTTSNKDATVKVNGVAVISGLPSEPITLQTGANKVEVAVTAQDGTEKLYTITVERKFDPITEIVLNKKQLSLTVGDRPVILKAEVKPNQDSEHLLVWTSSSPDIATVDQNGKVVPLGKGTAVITVSSPDGKVTDSCIVDVKEGKVLALLTDPTMLVMQPDESATVQVSAFFGNESKRDVTKDVTWTTKDKKVATVSKGKIKAVGKGSTLITASYKGKKATILVNVYDKLWVDEREVEVTLTRSGSSSYSNLKVEGKILEDDDLSVKVVYGKSVYTAKVDKDEMTFTFERKIKVNSKTSKEIELQLKPKGSDEDEQVIILPIELFDPDSIKVKEGRNDSYTITGEVYNPSVINKIEIVVDGEVLSIGSIQKNQFELKLAKWKGDKLILRATAYNGFVQEYEVEVE